MGKENSIVSLDIGTTKIAVIISELQESGEPKIVGIGTSRSEGLKRGVVVNLEKTVESIAQAVEDAELMSGVKVHSVFAGIAGDHIRSINSRGVIAISRSGNDPEEPFDLLGPPVDVHRYQEHCRHRQCQPEVVQRTVRVERH